MMIIESERGEMGLLTNSAIFEIDRKFAESFCLGLSDEI